MSQYLQRYAEAEAQALLEDPAAEQLPAYRHCLIIPAYRESPDLLAELQQLTEPGLLIILVLNHPPSGNAQENTPLRDSVLALPKKQDLPAAKAQLLELSKTTDCLLVERDKALPGNEGVGLARKLGCDIATALAEQNKLDLRWLHCTDADATLPSSYFQHAQKLADHYVAIGPIHHPVVIRQTQRQHLPRLKLRTVPNRFYFQT